MKSENYRRTQQMLAQLVDQTLYPSGTVWNDIARFVRAHPEISHYTLTQLEQYIGKKGFTLLTAALRLSMPPYDLFEASFELTDSKEAIIVLSIKDYQQCALNGGFKDSNGTFISIEQINQNSVIHLIVKKA
ncbi:hypothetical protein [Marinomonas ostreistagni]|uniref:Uncharacterized protein n=1 Tax=Marinomonas ostreistagni TaxID=359209 RepID=A0ABS0ZGC1_9GAMM|nr:hypothetical protein [Marinomonas ostreistagni]MBJ7552483.1 hypothetical protein [Marinomonas ostreistagni]